MMPPTRPGGRDWEMNLGRGMGGRRIKCDSGEITSNSVVMVRAGTDRRENRRNIRTTAKCVDLGDYGRPEHVHPGFGRLSLNVYLVTEVHIRL